jgi:flavin-binding protein dodecin
LHLGEVNAQRRIDRRKRGNEPHEEAGIMTIAKTIEVSADSKKSFEDAIQQGISRAGESLEHVNRAWVKDQIVLINDGKIDGYRVHMNVTFTLN